MRHRERFDPRVLPAYGQLLSGKPRPLPGDTCRLQKKQVYVLAVDGDLCRVLFIEDEQRTATVHIDLLR